MSATMAARHEQENKVRAEENRLAGYPAMTGTKKQVGWAESIRYEWMKYVDPSNVVIHVLPYVSVREVSSDWRWRWDFSPPTVSGEVTATTSCSGGLTFFRKPVTLTPGRVAWINATNESCQMLVKEMLAETRASWWINTEREYRLGTYLLHRLGPKAQAVLATYKQNADAQIRIAMTEWRAVADAEHEAEWAARRAEAASERVETAKAHGVHVTARDGSTRVAVPVIVQDGEITVHARDGRVATGRVGEDGVWRITAIGKHNPLDPEHPETRRIADEARGYYEAQLAHAK